MDIVLSPFLTGFFLGLSLIIAIGAQNTFVLRQGIIGQHVFYVSLFCALSDTILIIIGVSGMSFFFNNVISQISNLMYGISALWLAGYGILRLKSIFKSEVTLEIEASSTKSLLKTISVAAILTFANPHVYLDTMILIGSVSQNFIGSSKIAFTFGASISSFVFFFGLSYGAGYMTPILKNPFSWKILDGFIAIIMFTISIKLAFAGNWL
jgi:L-lysine exporter family protein LysE/ArgO